MDKSIRLPLVLGVLKVPAEQLDQGEWIVLIERALAFCKPHIKFFPGFKSVEDCGKELSLCRANDFKIEVDNVDMVSYPRFAVIAGKKVGAPVILLLTREGELVEWQRSSRWVGAQSIGVRTDYLWRFRYLSIGDFFAEMTPDTAKEVLQSLQRLVEGYYQVRLKYAESARRLRDTFSGILERIG